MAPDYRSHRMDSPEGRGIARRTWEAYRGSRMTRKVSPALSPFLRPVTEPVSRQMATDLVGFWVLWHLYGGFEGLERFGFHKSTIWRKVHRFRDITGEHPDEYEMPGITIDAEAYWKAAGMKIGRR